MSWINSNAEFLPRRNVGGWVASVTISESAQDDLEITQHPVQDGAAITDHAYKKPVMLSVEAQYSDNLTGVPIDEMYRRLLTLQNTREPMDVVTGKRIYRNMLIKSISETTDKTTDKVLSIKMDLQEIILVAVSTVKIPASSQKKAAQKEPKRTGQTENGGVRKGEPTNTAAPENPRSGLAVIVRG